MLPPILEIFVIWHPEDHRGADFARAIFEHFMQGPTFSGVIGGGVQVSLRSAGWDGPGTAPRPIYTQSDPAPNGIRPASFVAVVPLLGTEMADCVESTSSQWHGYIATIQEMQGTSPDRIGVFPFLLNAGATDGTALGKLLGKFQFIAANDSEQNGEDVQSMLSRDLTQGLAQLIRKRTG